MDQRSNNSKEDNLDADFWDLGDDDLDATPTTAPVKPPTEQAPPAPKPAPPAEENLFAKAEQSDLAAPPTQAEQDPEPEEPQAPAQPIGQAPSPKTENVTWQRVETNEKPLGKAEKTVSYALVALLLIGAFTTVLLGFYKHAPQKNLLTYDQDFPIKGQHVAFSEISTFWRAPVRGGTNTDRGIQLDAKLIPCAELTAEPGANGVIRYAFRDEDGSIVGDSPTLTITNGTFATTGEATATINCTGGFRNPSRLNAYVNNDFLPWTLEIFEAGPGATPERSEEPLVKVLIAPHRLEEIGAAAESTSNDSE